MANSVKDSKILAYKDEILQLNTTIKVLTATIESLQRTLETDREEKQQMQEKIDYLTRKLFGTSSESSKGLTIPGQQSLFDEAEQDAFLPEDPLEADVAPETNKRRKHKRTNADLFRKVPQEDRILSLTDEQLYCPECGTKLEVIGKELVRQEFHFTPARGKVINYYRETAKCPECSNASTMEKNIQFVKAYVPEALIPHSYASASAVAWIMYQKYVNATPLYRQEYNWNQLGVELSRATMANWIIYCAQNHLKLFYDYLHSQLKKRKFLMADETRVQVLKEPQRAPQTDSFMWLFRTGEDGLPPIILYHYTETRAKFHAVDFLKGFQGYLETDGYQGYNNLPNVVRCCCYAHLRRYFVEAIPKGKALDLSDPAVQAVQYCDQLFRYERLSLEKGHTFEQRKEYRLQKEKPIVEAFWKWLETVTPRKGTRFAKAVNYAQNQKSYFMNYLEDGRCSFSNNLSENSIRPFTVGRKNWLFSDTPKGADSSAIVYTMVEMAKAHNLNVYKYIEYLLEKLPNIRQTEDELAKLVPWNPEIQECCSGAL